MADELPATSSTGAMGSSGARASGGEMLGGARSTAGSVSGYGGQYLGSGRKLSRSYWWGCLRFLICEQPRSHWFARHQPVDANLDSTNASVISSQGSNMHLDSGTEMILRVNQ
jgi:hypothetical protein